MSWLKSTISKVRESSEALKQNQTLKSLKEKTSSAVASAAEKATDAARGAGDAVQKLKLGRTTKASELEAQLEQRARAAKTLQSIAELHRSWLQHVTSKDGYSAEEEGEREISFKEVLLRSCAIEITVEIIASDPALRRSYAEPPASDDKASPVACLYMLLSKTLACPVSLWSEVLKLAVAEDGLLCENHSTWIIGVIGAMKADAHEEALYGERKDLALRAERLRQEIKELEAPSAGGEGQDEMHRRRLAASTELLRTYEAVRRNLEDAQTHRQEALTTRQREISLISEQIQAYIVGLQSSVHTSKDRQKHLEGELKQSQESIEMQVQNMGDARSTIDRELEELEKRKHALKMELEEVARMLEDARQRQREHMGNSDRQRLEIDEIKRDFKEKIESEEHASRDAVKEQAIVERCQQLVRETDTVVQKSLGGQLEELKSKQGQFNDHFREVMREHLSHEEEHMRRLRRRAEDSFASLETQPQVVADVEAANVAFLKFRDEYREMLASADEVALVERLVSEHAAIRQLLLPGMSLPEQGDSAGTADAEAVNGSDDSTTQAAAPSVEIPAPTAAQATVTPVQAAPSTSVQSISPSEHVPPPPPTAGPSVQTAEALVAAVPVGPALPAAPVQLTAPPALAVSTHPTLPSQSEVPAAPNAPVALVTSDVGAVPVVSSSLVAADVSLAAPVASAAPTPEAASAVPQDLAASPALVAPLPPAAPAAHAGQAAPASASHVEQLSQVPLVQHGPGPIAPAPPPPPPLAADSA